MPRSGMSLDSKAAQQIPVHLQTMCHDLDDSTQITVGLASGFHGWFSSRSATPSTSKLGTMLQINKSFQAQGLVMAFLYLRSGK